MDVYDDFFIENSPSGHIPTQPMNLGLFDKSHTRLHVGYRSLQDPVLAWQERNIVVVPEDGEKVFLVRAMGQAKVNKKCDLITGICNINGFLGRLKIPR
jgi:hypothetical protein